MTALKKKNISICSQIDKGQTRPSSEKGALKVHQYSFQFNKIQTKSLKWFWKWSKFFLNLCFAESILQKTWLPQNGFCVISLSFKDKNSSCSSICISNTGGQRYQKTLWPLDQWASQRVHTANSAHQISGILIWFRIWTVKLTLVSCTASKRPDSVPRKISDKIHQSSWKQEELHSFCYVFTP